MKRTKRERSKKEVIFLEVLGLVLGVLGFIAVIIPAVLSDENGHYENGWIFLLAFFALEIVAIVIMLNVLPDLAVLEVDRMSKKYSAAAFSKLQNIGKEDVKSAFLQHGFKETASGFYRKKIFCFSKDSICYYLAIADADEIEETCDNVLDRLDDAGEKTKNICLILMMYKHNITKADKMLIRDMASNLIIDESVLPSPEYQTMIPILVDASTKQGFYLAKTKGISVYAHGCKLLKKYLQ